MGFGFLSAFPQRGFKEELKAFVFSSCSLSLGVKRGWNVPRISREHRHEVLLAVRGDGRSHADLDPPFGLLTVVFQLFPRKAAARGTVNNCSVNYSITFRLYLVTLFILSVEL